MWGMNKQEYEERFHANEKFSGMGIETTMHMPCPFCAAPDFMIYRILDTPNAIKRGAVCQECKRGCRAVLKEDGHGVAFEFVQTQGPAPPDYILPMRRG